MKFLKALIVTLSALLFTGCYTQLQYTSKMKRITDREAVSGGYAQKAGESEGQQQATQQSYDSGYYGGEADNIPLYYKDYAYAQKWADCGCNPYTVYNFYGYDYYDPYLTLDPFYFYHWRPYHYYGHHYPYFGSRFNFSITFGWGNPYYYDPFYYDPFFYNYYWYGGSPFAFNYYRYYSGYGSYGYHNYHGSNNSTTTRNVRYGPRTIGTNRTNADGQPRSRNINVTTTGRSAVTSSSTVRPRTRTTGVTRVRSTSTNRTSGSAVTRSRNRTVKSSGTTRSRSRGTVQQNGNRQRQLSPARNRSTIQNRDDQSHSVIIRSRTRLGNNSFLANPQSRSDIQQRLANQRVGDPNVNVLERVKRNRPTFFNRVKKFLNNSVSRSSANYNWHIRSRSSSSSIGRSSNSSHSRSHSSVSRSRSHSSSTHSRSSGSSSRSRSSSGGSSRSRSHHN